jgi:hypothetical protein
MIKSIGLIVLGAIGALQADKWLSGVRARVSPRAVTDSLLEKANTRLEQGRSSSR